MLKQAVITLLAAQSMETIMGIQERHQVFRQAREYADAVGKPLLVVGTPRWVFSHGCGDVTIDINPNPRGNCEVEVADVRAIPYPDGYFGATHCSHVLEHLPTIADCIQALDEMERVADRVFVVSPRKTSLIAWLYPRHHLWVTPTGDGYIIEQRGQGFGIEPESYVVAMEVV